MSQNAYTPPVGPEGQITYASADLGIPAATALAGSATVTGTLIPSRGIRSLAVDFISTHAGTAKITTYLDAAGTLVGEVTSGTLVGNTALTVYTPAGHAFESFKVSITDTSTTAGTCQALGGVGQN